MALLRQYKNNNATTIIHPDAQKYINVYPSYLRARYDEATVYFGIYNALAKTFGHLENAIQEYRQELNSNLNLNKTLDTIYIAKYQEGEYTSDLGILQKSQYDSIEKWFFESTPVSAVDDNIFTIDKVLIQDTINAFSNITFSKPSPLFLYLDIPNNNYITLDKDNNIYPTTITITGLDEYGNDIYETFYIYYPIQLKSKYYWHYIKKINVYTFTDSENIQLFLSSYPFYSQPSFIKPILDNTIYEDSYRNIVLKYYQFENNNFTSYIVSGKNLQDIYIKQFLVQKENDFSLFAYSATEEEEQININQIKAYTIDDKNIYILHNENVLLLYQKHRPVSLHEKAIKLKTKDPLVSLIPDINGDTVNCYLDYNYVTRLSKAYKFRITVIYDNDVKYILNNPQFNGIVNNNWQYYNNEDVWFTYAGDINSQFYKLFFTYTNQHPQYDYLLRVEVIDDNMQYHSDVVLIRSNYKYPVAQIGLPSTIDINNVIGIDFTRDGFLGIFETQNNNTIKVHNIQLLSNTYLKDGDNIFFEYKYPNLKVNSENVAVAEEKVLCNVDHFGYLHALERLPKERAYEFAKIVRYAYRNPFNSSRTGLQNALSAELRILPQNIALLNTNSLLLDINYPKITIKVNGNTIEKSFFDFISIADFIEYLMYNFYDNLTIELLDYYEQWENKPLRHIMNCNNFNLYNNLIFNGATILRLPIQPSETLLFDTLEINGYNKDNIAQISENTVVTQAPLGKDNYVSFMTVKPIIIKASHILLSSLYDMEDVFLQNRKINQHALDIISAAENKFPYRFSK